MSGLSAGEKKWILDGVESNFRSDGRSRHDYRNFSVTVGDVESANGSARVVLDDTVVLACVKVDVCVPPHVAPDKGLLEISVDCTSAADPGWEGRGSEEINTYLGKAMERAYASALDVKGLCISPGKLVWIVYLDAVVLSHNGNLLDAIALASRAALMDTRLPKITVQHVPFDWEINDDPYEAVPLNVEGVPVCVTLTKLGKRFVVDTTEEEEKCEGIRVHCSINKAGNICSVQMGGSGEGGSSIGGIEPPLMVRMLQTAQQVSKKLFEKLEREGETKSE